MNYLFLKLKRKILINKIGKKVNLEGVSLISQNKSFYFAKGFY